MKNTKCFLVKEKTNKMNSKIPTIPVSIVICEIILFKPMFGASSGAI